MSALTRVTNGRTSPPGSPIQTVPKATRKLRLKKTDSAPSLNLNLPPLNTGTGEVFDTGVKYLSRHDNSKRDDMIISDAPTSPNTCVSSSSSSGPQDLSLSPRFIRHRGKSLKHSSLPDMRRVLISEQQTGKTSLTRTRSNESPTSMEHSPDLLRRVLQRTTSFGSDELSCPPSTPGSSPVTNRRKIYSAESSPLIRRRSGSRLCEMTARMTNAGTNMMPRSGSPVPSPRISLSRQSARPDTPVPTTRTNVRSSSHNDLDILVLGKIKKALDDEENEDRYLTEDPEEFVEFNQQKLSQGTERENIKNYTASESYDHCGGNLAKEGDLYDVDINTLRREEALNDDLELRTVDPDETITFICEETIDETPEYQKEPEPTDLRIRNWLANVDSNRWEAKNVMLPHITSSSNI
ncbi:uncharacterized protein LOC144446421 [Glandiceps talaboti]